MEKPCYRCGTQIEEHTTFCPSCGAPQIKVTVPVSAPANQTAPQPLPPGPSDSIQPPSAPLSVVPAGRIRWKKFWRLGVPLAMVSAVVASSPAGLLGILLFLVSLVVAIAVYRREHPTPLTTMQGATLGAVMGLVSWLFVLIFSTVKASLDWAKFRQDWLDNLHQRIGTNPDPQLQPFIHWASTNQGIVVIILLSAVITAVFIAVLTGIIGAITASASGKRR